MWGGRRVLIEEEEEEEEEEGFAFAFAVSLFALPTYYSVPVIIIWQPIQKR